jgi:cytochrome c556
MRRLQTSLGFALAAVLAGALLAGWPASTVASDDNAIPKFSTFASADDLAAEVKFLVADLGKAVDNEDDYKSQAEGRFIRDGNTITLIAIALGLHDQDSPLKPHAKAIAAAARKLAQTKDFATTKQTNEDLKACLAATKQAVQDLKAAVGGQGVGGDELKWGKVAKLNSLMKDEVPNVNTKLKTGLRHFKTRSGEAASNAATVALIAENAMLYVGDTKKPTEAAKWIEFAAQMRAAASDVAAKVHAGDEAGANAAMDKLNDSCTACHRVFNPEKQ